MLKSTEEATEMLKSTEEATEMAAKYLHNNKMCF